MSRIALFIDGNNFEAAVNALYGREQRLMYDGLAEYIAREKCDGELLRFFYYTARSSSKADPEKYKATGTFIHTLSKLPKCTVREGFLKSEATDASGKPIYVEKGTDVNIAVDMLVLAYSNAYDQAVLLSADSDYKRAIEVVRMLGKIVTLGLVDGQKGGFLKSICDSHVILSREDLDKLRR